MNPTTVGLLAQSHQRDLDIEAAKASLVAEAKAASRTGVASTGAAKPSLLAILAAHVAAATHRPLAHEQR